MLYFIVILSQYSGFFMISMETPSWFVYLYVNASTRCKPYAGVTALQVPSSGGSVSFPFLHPARATKNVSASSVYLSMFEFLMV